MLSPLRITSGCSLTIEGCWTTSARLAQRLGMQVTSMSSDSNPSEPSQPATSQSLDKQQLQAIESAVASATQHAAAATQLAALTSMAGSYRDITVAMESVYAVQVQGQHPLSAQAPPARPAPPRDPYLSSTLFPLVDVTQLPDDDPSVPQGPQQYDKQYMDRITCWMQTQPNHVETSTMLQTGIALFPPQEASYPTYIDFQAATRMLERHKSHKKMSVLKKIRRFQDKYQLKTWDHRRGEL